MTVDFGRRKAEGGKRSDSLALSLQTSSNHAAQLPLSALPPSPLPPSAFPPPRSGISLIEVLISMFVMLFGLMGVASIFPVGNYYVVEGEKHDMGSLLAANAFEEIQARGMLRPELWLYAGTTVGTTAVPTETGATGVSIGTTNGNEVIQPVGAVNPGWLNIVPGVGTDPGSGHAWVIDPMSTAAAITGTNLDVWPINDHQAATNTSNPWLPAPAGSLFALEGRRWPVRRISLPQAAGVPLTTSVAETIFRLRNDLAVEMPERDDAPSIQRWRTADIDSVTGNPNNTPNDPNDDTLLTRQYHGNYSWLATIVPLTEQAHEGLQPALRQSYPYEVSVAVFYKRVPTPSAETERLLRAELLPGGELVMYGDSTDEVDKGLDGIKSGAWVAVMGVNQTTGAFMMKWYRLLALDEETYSDIVVSEAGSNFPLRRAMLLGPDWPATPDPAKPGFFLPYVANLRVAIFPGITSVVTREMVMEQNSLWRGD